MVPQCCSNKESIENSTDISTFSGKENIFSKSS